MSAIRIISFFRKVLSFSLDLTACPNRWSIKNKTSKVGAELSVKGYGDFLLSHQDEDGFSHVQCTYTLYISMCKFDNEDWTTCTKSLKTTSGLCMKNLSGIFKNHIRRNFNQKIFLCFGTICRLIKRRRRKNARFSEVKLQFICTSAFLSIQ